MHLGIRKYEGQSYDDDAVAVDGKQDHYRELRIAQGSGEELTRRRRPRAPSRYKCSSKELTTQVQAEGAIDVQSMWASLQVSPQTVHSSLSVGSASSV